MTVARGDDVTPELTSLAAIHGGCTERWKNDSGKTVLAARIIFGLFFLIIFTSKRLYSKHLPRKGDQGETKYAFMYSFLLIILFMFLFGGGILVLYIGLLAIIRIMFTTDFLVLRQNLKPYGVWGNWIWRILRLFFVLLFLVMVHDCYCWAKLSSTVKCVWISFTCLFAGGLAIWHLELSHNNFNTKLSVHGL